MRTRFPVLATTLIAASATSHLAAQSTSLQRPVPYPVEMSRGFERAIERGTRSESGAPGLSYWQQWSDYTITARLDAEAKRIDGTVRIVYHNRSPRPLPMVTLQLAQNVHAEGAMRNRPGEVTGGYDIVAVRVDGEPVTPAERGNPRGYRVFGTAMALRLPRAVQSGQSVTLEVDFGFKIPQRGAGSRMGWNDDNLFYLAYWYPQMAVLDDVVGWHNDAFLTTAEFYMGYGSYDVTLEVPHGWTVWGTGQLTNAGAVMPDPILARLRRAEESDTVVHILTAADFGVGTATRRSDTGYLSWNFVADSVRDVAYAVTRESLWDAARTPVGDRDGDGVTDYALATALYREAASRWVHEWRYVQHSIDFLSRWTGLPYPWPHMTAVEGAGIMGGGMEYPMMTLIGDFTQAGDTALYGVTAHELAHMWLPMIVGVDERRHAWMDEGTTSFNTSAAENEFFAGRRWELDNYRGYLQITRTDLEGEIMRWSDFHYNGMAFGTASYAKPAALLWTLHGLLGEDTFLEAYRTYIREWAYRHPRPWDFFNTFNRVSGQDLDWFWRSWYFETWTLDQAIKDVMLEPAGTKVTVEDRGWAPMPVRLTLTTADGEHIKSEIGVDAWLSGAREADIVVKTSSPVVKVEIDAAQVFPDVNRENNVWERR